MNKLDKMTYEEYEELTEEEIDEYYRPQKTNNRKSLLPLFVYLVLKKYSSPEKPLKQQEIIYYLTRSPYEINVERKAVGRVIHALVDSDLGIVSEHKVGTWFE